MNLCSDDGEKLMEFCENCVKTVSISTFRLHLYQKRKNMDAPKDYLDFIGSVKDRIRNAQYAALQ